MLVADKRIAPKMGNMFLYKQKLLSPTMLRKLSEHKYSVTNVSILDPFLQPWWCWLVGKVPMWLAPNLITIVGLIVNIVTALILISYSPDGRSEPPRWACAMCALGIFFYQSLDAIDGKQARRTNSSSPLGELFDHGCDSISTIFVAVSACISVQLGFYPKWMFFQCFCAMTLFYCAHWQTYVSGTLNFGRVDVTEAQATIMGIHLISAVFGPGIWKMQLIGDYELWSTMSLMTIVCGAWSLFQIFGVILAGGVGKNGSTVALPFFDGTCNLIVCLAFFIGFMQVFIGFCQIFVVGGIGKNGSTVAFPWTNIELLTIPFYTAICIFIYLSYGYAIVIFTGGVGRHGSTVAGTSVLSPIIPFSMVVVPAFIISQKSTDHVFETYPSLYIMAFGMVCAKVTNRLVVAHMTKSELAYIDWGLIGPMLLFLNQYFDNFIPEYYVLWATMIWCTIDLMRYSSQVCLEICDHLNIELFRIPYPPKPPQMNTQVVTTTDVCDSDDQSVGQFKSAANMRQQPLNGERKRLISSD